MSSVAGSIESFSIRGRLFPVAADADSNMKIGGFEAEIQPNGDGTARKVLTRVPWMIDGLTASIDHDREDLQFLQARANEPGFEAITITYADGSTYQGDGTVTGEFQFASQSSTASVTLSGPGEMTLQ